MKLAQFSVDSKSGIGKVVDRGLIDLSRHIDSAPAQMVELIQDWARYESQIASLDVGADYALSEVILEAPIRRPGKILCIGLNYADHVEEAKSAGVETPEHQVWFTKATTAVNGPFGEIELPIVSDRLDYEAELAFVIGRRCRHVSEDEARSCIFGFCAGNDVSVRDWQLRTGQFMIGKSFDTHAPFGPWLVTPDEIDEYSLGIRCFVNGEKRQDSNTRHLIFDCAVQIAHLSQAMTLEPGDVIFTGTPGGVGATMDPPSFLKAGDVVKVEIDGIGAIENTVVTERRSK